METKSESVEHLTTKQLEDYCRQQLQVAELLSVSDHLGECEVCRHWTESTMNNDLAFFDLRSEIFGEADEIASLNLVRTHLTVEQTLEYVDSNLSGEELQTVTDHLITCEQCALVVDDLQNFKNQIVPSLEREYQPATAPAEGWLHRTVASLTSLFQRSPVLAFGTALAVLLLAVTGWLIWQRQSRIEPKQEIANQPAPPPPPTTAPTAAVPIIAQINDGEAQLTLDQEGKLSGADNLPPAYQSMLKGTLTTRHIEMSSQLKGLSRPSSSLMSTDKEGNKFSVIEPVGKVMMSDRPTFRWSPMEGATGYIVEVYDSKLILVAGSPQLTSNSWAPPQPFSRGSFYTWQVKAIKDGQEFTSPRPPAPQARFRILDQAKANELAKAKQAYASSHLTLGLLYAEAGLLNEAEQELHLLQKANPDSEIAHSLLSQVQALRH